MGGPGREEKLRSAVVPCLRRLSHGGNRIAGDAGPGFRGCGGGHPVLPGGDLRATSGCVQPASATLSVDGRAEVRQSRVIRVGLSQCGHLVRKLFGGGDVPYPGSRRTKKIRVECGGGLTSSESSARRAESRRGSSSSGTAAPCPGVRRTVSLRDAWIECGGGFAAVRVLDRPTTTQPRVPKPRHLRQARRRG